MTERLSWAVVEDAPRMIAVADPVDGGTLGHYAEVDESLGLTDQMADKFRAVCDVVDQGGCEANVCQDSPYERDGVPVGAGIGWGLAGDADERVEWTPVVLVQHGLRVTAVCIACGPESVYDALWVEQPEQGAKPVHS